MGAGNWIKGRLHRWVDRQFEPPFLAKIQAHISELQLKCEPVGATDKVLTIEAPPQKRLD